MPGIFAVRQSNARPRNAAKNRARTDGLARGAHAVATNGRQDEQDLQDGSREVAKRAKKKLVFAFFAPSRANSPLARLRRQNVTYFKESIPDGWAQ
jgi:hypothetical protein